MTSMDEAEQVRIMQNDHLILDNTKRIRDGDSVTLELDGEYFPDGRAFRLAVQELNVHVFQEWCNTVRGEWNARNQRKEAAAVSKAPKPAPVSAESEADGEGGIPGGGVLGGEEAVQAGETGVEEYLQAQVDAITNRIAFTERRISEYRRNLSAAEEFRLLMLKEKDKVKKALEVFKDAPIVRKEDSGDVSGKEEKARKRRSRKVVR